MGFLLLAAIALIILTPTGKAASQTGGEVSWSAPELLTSPTAVLQQAAVAADPWGGIHVFWMQNEVEDITTGDATNMIYYTHWDGRYWSRPYDLFAGPEWSIYSYPFATSDAKGRLYLTWSGPEGLYYSSASAPEAYDAKNWQGPYLLAEQQQVGYSSLAIDSRGILHLVYNTLAPGTNVMYLQSVDRGETWSEPVAVSELFAAYPQVPDRPRIAIDGQDNLHVVWAENYPPEWIGRQVLYNHSEDGGETWEAQQALSEVSMDSEWNANIDIAIDTDDGIHVVWVCERVHRCYRHSDNGGWSWSATARIFGTLLGRSGWDAMAADPNGRVYWLGALREPQGIYFSQLEDGNLWQDPPTLLIDAAQGGQLGQAHFPHLTVSRGNQLHAIMVAGDKGPIWHIAGETGFPPSPVPPTPTMAPLPTPTQPVARATATNTTATPQAIVTIELGEPLSSVSEGMLGIPPLAWALAPVGLLIAIVLAFRNARRR